MGLAAKNDQESIEHSSGAMTKRRYLASVVIPPLAQPYTYEVPPEIEKQALVGTLVSVPLGKRFAQGYVVSRDISELGKSEEKFKIKSIVAEAHPRACFTPKQLEFFQWIADYYGEPLSNVIEVAIPPLPVRKFQTTVRLTSAAASYEAKGSLQAKLLTHLQAQKEEVQTQHLSRKFPGAAAALKALAKVGVVELQKLEVRNQLQNVEAAPAWAKTSVTLTDAQISALKEIEAAVSTNQYKPMLLHGITGSGKTEVYIEAIHHALRLGKTALIIVPEIALTPQLLDRFRARLGDNLAVLHSALHKRLRWESWQSLLETQTKIAIGARSGIFAPLDNVGLIIVDEEHESSYKQSDGLRYHARDLALVRGKQEGCTVLLGSATPSLESYAHARSGRYALLTLPARPQSSAGISVEVINVSKVPPWEMASKNLTPQLCTAIQETLSRQEQVFLLYNRRGFASYLQCESCQSSISCPNCSVTLTFHRSQNQLLCHYCNLSLVPPSLCPTCPKEKQLKEPSKLVLRGAGTEKIFEELQELFPQVNIARLDRDIVTDESSYRALLDGVRNGTVQVLIGTQMIAKGHDLPGVTLVGVVDCDVGLHMPDFRAGERVFQLLTQAAGRAGRGDKPGKVLLQTRVPNHPSIELTNTQNFEQFAVQELQSRELHKYPPYTRLLRIVCSSADNSLAENFARSIREAIVQCQNQHGLTLRILGPTPAPIARIKTLWRWHLLVKAQSAVQLNRVVRDLAPSRAQSKKVRVVFDMDPQELM